MRKLVSSLLLSLILAAPITLNVIPCEPDPNNADICTPPDSGD